MKCNHYLRVLRFILKFSKFTYFPILLAKDLHLNSLKGKVWNNRMKKTCRHFKNYIPIPFSALWYRRAGIRRVRLMQKITTAICHRAQPGVSRFASCPAWLWTSKWASPPLIPEMEPVWSLAVSPALPPHYKRYLFSWTRSWRSLPT